MRVQHSSRRLTSLMALCAASVAQASGFYLGDNGAKAMVQGGAFAAQADDLTAIQYNPAGLAQLPGSNFLADLQVLRQEVTFSRQDPGFDPAQPAADSSLVRNAPVPFLLPFLALSYGFPIGGRTFTVAAGVYGPPGQGTWDYPAPNYARDALGNYVETPRTHAPERFVSSHTDSLIAYPTLSAAYDFHPRLKVGLSMQLVVSRFRQTQTLYRNEVLGDNPQQQLLEDPASDAVVSTDLAGQVGFTGIFGVLWRPTNWLSIGGALRPPTPIKARGALSVELPPEARAAGVTVSGDRATLNLTMPLELSFGTRIMPLEGQWKERLAFNVDVVYQGWGSIDSLVVRPENVSLSDGSGAEPRPLPPLVQQKHWMPTWSVRVGSAFRLHHRLSLHFGTLYESAAARTATYTLDWAQPARFLFTGGVTLHLPPFEVIAGAEFTPTLATVVTDSTLARAQTSPEPAGVVGNGLYTSGAWGLLFGFRIHFGEVPPAPTLDDTSPPPVQAPMPANPEKLPVEPTLP